MARRMRKPENEEVDIEIIESEVDSDYSDDDLYNITSWGADLSFRELIAMYQEGEMIKPELQRKYVWDRQEASRFIESLLLGLPVPSIFLAKVADKRLIIDGYQRIMTVHDYVRGVFAGDNKVFKLSNTAKINSRWRGKAFSELGESDQRKIRSTTIHAIIFEQKHPRNDTSMYQVFERINTSGRTLLPQEIRNCVYQGPFNKMLMKVNDHRAWRKLFGSNLPDSRMRDVEYILRFFALRSADVRLESSKQIALKKYLNDFMAMGNHFSGEKLEEMAQLFTQTCDSLLKNLGVDAFRNLSPQKGFVQRFHPTVFDAIAITTSFALESEVKIPSDLKDRHLRLLEDEEFRVYITQRTTNTDHIHGRLRLASEVLYNLSYATGS